VIKTYKERLERKDKMIGEMQKQQDEGEKVSKRMRMLSDQVQKLKQNEENLLLDLEQEKD